MLIPVKGLAGILEDLLEIIMNKRGGVHNVNQPIYPLDSLLLNEGLFHLNPALPRAK